MVQASYQGSVCVIHHMITISTITACNLLQIIAWFTSSGDNGLRIATASMLVATALVLCYLLFWLWKWCRRLKWLLCCHILTRLPSVCLAPDLLFAPKLLLIERQVRSGWYNTYLHLRTQISLTSSTMSHGISLLQQNTSISIDISLASKKVFAARFSAVVYSESFAIFNNARIFLKVVMSLLFN